MDHSTQHRRFSIFVLHASSLMTDHMPHGDGISAYGFLQSLAQRGHTIHVAAIKTAIRGPIHENMTIHYLPCKRTTGLLARIEYALRVRLLYERLSRQLAFDLIQQMVPVETGLSLSMIGTRIPVVLGTYVARWPYASHRLHRQPMPLRKRTAKVVGRVVASIQLFFARALLVTAPAAAHDFAFSRFFRKRIFEIHHGIDIDTYTPPTHVPDARAERILYLGALGTRKGIFTLIEAFELVHRRNPRARLLIAGRGEQEGALKERLLGLSCAENVDMLGPVSREVVADTFRSAAIYCAPAYAEPYATALLEAMACGAAVVISDSGGAPFMVPRSGGRCVRTRDAQALADALVDLLATPQATLEMGRENRRFVEQENAWPKVIERLEDAYAAILDDPPRHINFSSSRTFGAAGLFHT